MILNTRTHTLDLQTVIDGMAQAVLVFAPDGSLILDNVSARRLLGADLMRIRAGGWPACAAVLDAGRGPDAPRSDEGRAQALKSTTPVPFSTWLDGVYLSGSIAAIYGQGGQVLTQICLQSPDWTPFAEMATFFRDESRTVVDATRGHTDLIVRLLKKRPDDASADWVAGRVLGFAEVIASHLYRLQSLIDLVERMEEIVTGRVLAHVAESMARVPLGVWCEDLLDELLSETLVDPELGRKDYADHIVVNIPEGLDVVASEVHLRNVIRDLLRNAILYSPDGAPIIVQAARTADGRAVRMDVIDRGCGVRAREAARVFQAFQRARQPQVLSQFGYGLSLYLARAEVEAMGGRLWFESEEGMGSTFSVRLPAWDESRHNRDRELDDE